MSSIILSPFQLLELNVISAQDLEQVCRKMRTYAVAWIHPDRKLSTRMDLSGHNNPTWNDKFVFRVDNHFLHGDTSAVMIEIYAVHWFRDIHIGTVRVIVGNLIPPPRPFHHQQQHGMRFIALQVRRPSGRPQGILNIGVAVLDSSMRSMPLYTQLSTSAVGYRQFMGEEDAHHPNNNGKDDANKPELRRTKSDSSSMVGLIKKLRGGSMVSGSGLERTKGRRSRASSLLNDAEFIKRGDPVKLGSIVNASGQAGALTREKYGGGPNSKSTTSSNQRIASKVGGSDLAPVDYVNMTDSYLGPSPSEVAAAVAKGKPPNRVEETESQVVGEWSWESSVEGLQSKLERWRTELPPVYDRSELSSFLVSMDPSRRRSGGRGENDKGVSKHYRRQTVGQGGTFTCFGNLCGLECTIVCGGGASSDKKGGRAKRAHSVDTFSFL